METLKNRSKFLEDAMNVRRRLENAIEMVDRVMAAAGDAWLPKVTRSNDVAAYLLLRHSRLAQEVLGALYLNAADQVIADVELNRGACRWIALDQFPILRTALEYGATRIVLWHIHPSGDPAPSAEDIAFTTKLTRGAQAIGLKVVDHLIIGAGRDRWVSLKARGAFSFLPLGGLWLMAWGGLA
jgi:DNA repair protein RadC